MPSKYSPWLEMQIKFQPMYQHLKVSLYACLGTVIRYWWMTGQSACRDWYFPPARNDFKFRNKIKSYGTRTWDKTVTLCFSSFINTSTMTCRRCMCLKPVAWRRFWLYFFCFFSTSFQWCFCPFSPAFLLRLFH